jgi:hypothetical protein
MLSTTVKQLWNDESGFIASTDLLLISTILVIGLLVGLVSVRDQIVQELGDVALAVGNLNHSYSFAGYTATFTTASATYTFTVAGSDFTDASDFCENGTNEDNTDPANQPPAGINVSVDASSEGN